MAAKSAEKLIQQIQESDTGDGEFLRRHFIDRRNSWCSRVYHVLLNRFLTDVAHCQLQLWNLCFLTLMCHSGVQLLPRCLTCCPHIHGELPPSWPCVLLNRFFYRRGLLSTAAVKFVSSDVAVSPCCSTFTLMLKCCPHCELPTSWPCCSHVECHPQCWHVTLLWLKCRPNERTVKYISVASESVYHICCHTLNYDIGLLLLLPLIKKPFPEYVNHPQPCNHTHYMRL